MWFAALSGNYQQSPWVVSLIDKLLDNVPSVVELMDENDLSQVSAKWLQTATSTTKLTLFSILWLASLASPLIH